MVKVTAGMFWRTHKKAQPKVSRETLGNIEFSLVRSARRSLALQIKSDATLVVRAPHRMPLPEIERWVLKKTHWIEKHQQKFRERKSTTPKYLEGEEHLFMGQGYPLHFIPASRPTAVLEGGQFRISTPDPSNSEKTERILKAWYKGEAETLFQDRLDALYPLLAPKGYKKPVLNLRWMKRQWGNLHTKGVMTLNIKLVRAPVELLDYVIIHELCHLEHMNHGKGFKFLLGELLPDWKARKKALEKFLD